jgi:ribonuclease BN (tRNA processing enzyme)
MQIHFVGSGDAFGNGGRFQTCIRLQAGDYTVLIDCGATSLTAMKAQHLDPGEVDAVVLSHLHGDHFGGLPFLILDGQFTRRSKTLTVLGPAGTRDRLHQAMETLYPGSASAQRRFPVEIIELGGDGGRQHSGPLTVASWEVDHASGAPPWPCAPGWAMPPSATPATPPGHPRYWPLPRTPTCSPARPTPTTCPCVTTLTTAPCASTPASSPPGS